MPACSTVDDTCMNCRRSKEDEEKLYILWMPLKILDDWDYSWKSIRKFAEWNFKTSWSDTQFQQWKWTNEGFFIWSIVKNLWLEGCNKKSLTVWDWKMKIDKLFFMNKHFRFLNDRFGEDPKSFGWCLELDAGAQPKLMLIK